MMTRATIDFGIDLGTTNSTIAVLNGKDIQIFKDNEGLEYTPSAVWLDRHQRFFVGRAARERLEDDEGNAFNEFKLQMGQEHEYRFARSGRVMKPEELSAEVLKALKGHVMQRMQEDIHAAVITVPAAFELPQCDATRKAAQLAGIQISPLLQEPIAAALSYGFQSQSDKVFWLVYDLGGGTFDAAIMQVRDGEIKVVNHGGDNHLGGKLIDWDIVERLFIPALTRTAHLTDFQRGNKRWQAPIAKLKWQAEQAKIRLSRDQSVEIHIEFLCPDERNQPLSFEYELTRSEVERLAEPYILRSINICKQALTQKRLKPSDIEKVLLVGGPTLMPYLRERLADRKHGLGIPVEFGIDPLTVVARGAAIFAGTQRLPQEAGVLAAQRAAGSFTVSFPDWTFAGSDTEPQIAGVVTAPALTTHDFQGFTVEFINSAIRPLWRSGQIRLAPNGAFLTTLWAGKDEPNTFQLELHAPTGRLVPCVTNPTALTYTVGLTISNVPLTHSVGVALANNEVEWFLEKGQSLPTKGRKVLHTAFEVHQGQDGDVIRIPVVEGESPRADRNRVIGKLEVTAQQVRRNVPTGSEVEINIEIDASRLLHTRAFVPLLDEEYEEVIRFGDSTTPDVEHMRQELEQEKKRLAKLQQASSSGSSPALKRIEREYMVRDVETALQAAETDPEAANKGDKRLRDLKMALDEVEGALEWPQLLAKAEQLLFGARSDINQYGTLHHKEMLLESEAELQNAIKARDVDLLRQCIGSLSALIWRALDFHGILPVREFEYLREMKHQMRNVVLANQLIEQGQQAIKATNMHSLRLINQQLEELLPKPPPPSDTSTVI